MFDYSRKPVKWQVGNFSYIIYELTFLKSEITDYPDCTTTVFFNGNGYRVQLYKT